MWRCAEQESEGSGGRVCGIVTCELVSYRSLRRENLII